MDASCRGFSSPRDISTEDVMLPPPTPYGRARGRADKEVIGETMYDVDTCPLRNLVAAHSPCVPKVQSVVSQYITSSETYSQKYQARVQ